MAKHSLSCIRMMKTAVFTIVALVFAPFSAMASPHNGLGEDDSFGGSVPIADKELGTQRGGTISIGGNLFTFTIAQNLTYTDPVSNFTKTQQTFFTTQTQTTNLSTGPVSTQIVGIGTTTAIQQTINIVMQSSINNAALSHLSTQVFSSRGFFSH